VTPLERSLLRYIYPSNDQEHFRLKCNLRCPLYSIHYGHNPICTSLLNYSNLQLLHLLFDNEILAYQILYAGLV
jgi:hypothetical protein